MRIHIPLALTAAALLATPALADRDPTEAETAQITRALNAAGFVRWESIEWDDDGYWEVDDAEREGADTEWDLRLAPRTFAILRSQRDDD